MGELLKWAVFLIYSALYWLTMAAGIFMVVIVVAAVRDTIRGKK